MRFKVILASILTVAALDTITIKFGVDYFKYRDIKFVCLFACENDGLWISKYSKASSYHSIATTSIDLNNLTDYNKVTKCLQQNLYYIGVLIESGCKETENVLRLASLNMMLDNNHKWLIITDSKDLHESNNSFDSLLNNDYVTTVSDVIGTLNVSVDSDIVMATRENSTYELHDVYNFGRIQGGKLIINQIGKWDNGDLNLKFNLNDYKYYRRWNFGNWSMRMILVISSTPKYFDMSLLSELQSIPGLATITHTSGAVLNVIAEIHNFRYIHTITDRWIGPYDQNSKRIVCNTLYFREQDISPVIRYLTSIQDKMDITFPTTSIETRYYYRIPTTGPGKFENQFLRPLSPHVWWCVIAVSMLCAILLLLTAWFEHRPSSVQYALFSVEALICQQFYQDTHHETKRCSTARKVTILVTGLSCVLIYNYYTSSVVSWLLNGPPPSINSLSELLESPLELIFEDVGYTRTWLQMPSFYYNKRNAKIENELRQKKVLNKKKDAPLLVPLVQGIKMVQNGGYAYHTEINSANSLISKMFTQSELCELGSLQSMERTQLFPCLQKNSPYKEFITWSLLRLKERGIVSCIQARMASKEAKCGGSSPRALALGGAAPAFILLAGGCVLATVIMFVERWIYRFNFKNKGVRRFWHSS